ncbi:MAG TPA: hypothetical protein VFA26_12070, partial [Gemmataceae bacterium]|nr:hypothetical protein [Gemmataceae bacterium]
MYKLLLCWRYLLTRYLAMACIVSVMLGVATLIVVNSVMSGFSTKLKDRLHGLLSDIVVEAPSYDGFPDPEGKMAAIRSDPFLDERIEAMTATMEVFAMLQFQVNGHTITRPVHLIGIDPEGRARIGGFAEHLVRQKNSAKPSFDLTAEGKRHNYEINHRPRLVWDNFPQPVQSNPDPREPPPPDPPPSTPHVPRGVILGFALGHVRQTNPDTGKPEDVPILQEGDEVVLTTLSGQRLAPVFDRFTVCDFIKTEMSDYDANYVFMPLDHLQHLRTTEGRVTSIQVRLKERKDAEAVQRRLQALFPAPAYNVLRWEQKQGAILAAISIEKGLLNVLLFLIIAVAGFGILA